MDLKVKVEEEKKGYVLINLAGDMDAYTSIQFRNIVNNLIKRGKHKLIVDMEKITCIDSVGAGMLLGGLKKTRGKKGNLWLIYNNSKAKRFLKITGLDKNFMVFKNRRQAYEELKLS